jgi:hypothetical protein
VRIEVLETVHSANRHYVHLLLAPTIVDSRSSAHPLSEGAAMKKRKFAGYGALLAVILLTLGCIATTPVPTGGPGTIEPPADTPTVGPGAIFGVLWHDTCQFTGGEAGEPVVLGQGCVQWGTESYEFGPNQVYDPYEVGWAGVTLHLGAGACPSASTATAVTDASGNYRFGGLSAGTYCVYYSALTDGNDVILIPGGPTYPERGADGLTQTVVLAAGEEREVNFGFAWQFYN